MSVETELKLLIASEDVDMFLQHPLLQTAVRMTPPQRLYNVYFDTPNCALLRHGIGLRVRHIGERRIQSVKTVGSSFGGIHRRQEWEIDIDHDNPDFDRLPKEVLAKESGIRFDQIAPIFIADFMRRTWDLAFPEDHKIELALDQGEVKTPTNSLPISEIELELKGGSLSKVYEVALALQKTIPLIIESHSKAARGYALYKPKPPQFHRASSLHLNTETTAEQAFITILWHCLWHLQANEDVVLCSDNDEGLHQMRVALRRLRSCLNLYKPLIPKKTHKHLREELYWITNILGIARDWDIFSETLEIVQTQMLNESIPLLSANESFTAATPTDDKLGLCTLQAQVAQQQKRVYLATREALRSRRYSYLLLLLGEWLTSRHWRQDLNTAALQALEQPVGEFASSVLGKQHRRIRQQGKYLRQLDTKQRHFLRILVKRMVYGTRFFMELYPRRLTRRYEKNLSQLQDELGVLNDVNTASQLLACVTTESQTPCLRHFLSGWYTHQQFIRLASLEKAWRVFRKRKKFWGFLSRA